MPPPVELCLGIPLRRSSVLAHPPHRWISILTTSPTLPQMRLCFGASLPIPRWFFPSTPHPSFNDHTLFPGTVAFFLNDGVYDADSEDEEWLKTHDNISVDEFEKIMERLEVASRSDIVQPMEARALLQRFDEQTVDDVYDYWLQKRKVKFLTKKFLERI